MKRAITFGWRWLYGAVSSCYLLTVGWLQPRHRTLLYQICEHFGYQPVRTAIPKISPQVLLDLDLPLVLHQPLAGSGEVSELELIVIAGLARAARPARLFEIGTLGGRTTVNLLANAGPDAEVFTLDLVAVDSSTAPLVRLGAGQRITPLVGDSMHFDFTPYEGSIDLVFVDANHEYDYVLSDSHHAQRLIGAQGGIILWHDYGTWDWPGSTHALNELYLKEPAFGQMRHVDGTTLVCLRVIGSQSGPG